MAIAVEGEVNFIGATSYAVYVGRQNSGSVIFHFWIFQDLHFGSWAIRQRITI